MVKSIPPTSFFCLTAQIYVLFVFWDVACGKVKLIEDHRWTNWFIGAGNLNLFGLVNYSSGGMAGDNVCRSSLSWAKVGRFKILFPLFLKRDIYNILSWWYHILSPNEKNIYNFDFFPDFFYFVQKWSFKKLLFNQRLAFMNMFFHPFFFLVKLLCQKKPQSWLLL